MFQLIVRMRAAFDAAFFVPFCCRRSLIGLGIKQLGSLAFVKKLLRTKA